MPISTKRSFNHDLDIDADARDFVAQRWGGLVQLVVDANLVKHFHPYEARAKKLKNRLQRFGSAAVLLMLLALLASTAGLLGLQLGETWPVRALTEASVFGGLLCAYLASRFGPWRREWLMNRFMTEILRQWHFRRFLNGRQMDALLDEPAALSHYISERQADLGALLQRLKGSVGQKMDAFVSTNINVLGDVPKAILPENNDLRTQLLDAYRHLRLDHQLDYASWKLSEDDRSFAGLSNQALVSVTETLSGVTLVMAMILSALHIFVAVHWASGVALGLALTGVATRAWRDGMSLNEERERYSDMRHRLEFLVSQWDSAETADTRFTVASQVEELATEELRSFIRTHEKAQFLF